MITLLEKQQPIPEDGLTRINEFMDAVASKDVVSFGICYVDRDGMIHSVHQEGSRNYALAAAADYLAVRVKAGL